MFQRIRLQLTPTSLLFRHGLRMALALMAGYGVLHLIHPVNGYWILLTTVFVCRPQYGATRVRLVQRIVGTVIGLLLAAPCWSCSGSRRSSSCWRWWAAWCSLSPGRIATPSPRGHHPHGAVLLQPGGQRFHADLAAAAGYPAGCLIAVLAVFFVLPDWQGRRLHQVMANTLRTNALYLRRLHEQYRTGKRDDLDYRVARRNAHNADATLSAALANMLRDPGHFRRNLEAGFRYLALSNTLLGYLSALGAHRRQLEAAEHDALVERAVTRIAEGMESIAAAVAERRSLPPTAEEETSLADELEAAAEDNDDGYRLVCTQLALICRLLPNLKSAANHTLREQTREQPAAGTADA